MKCSLVIVFVLNVILFVVIGITNSVYLSDYKLAPNPDAPTYVELGRSIWINGEYSRNLEPPFKPELTWTPVFPIVVGGLDILFGARGIFTLHIILSVACCILMYYLALPWTGNKIATIATFIFALDPFIYVYNFQAMSEILFLFFLLLGLTLTVPVVFCKSESKPYIRLIIGGLSFGLAILTRPAGLYIPIIMVFSAILWGLWKRNILYKSFIYASMLFFCSYLLVGTWMYRNYCVFGTFAVTGNDKITMVYYTAGGAWQIHNKCTLEEAQKLIQKEYNLPSVEVCHNINRFDITPQEIDVKMKDCRWKALFKYPQELIRSVATSIPKSLFAHETGLFAYLINQTWQAPRMENLKNPIVFSSLLFENSWILACFFLWSMIFQTSVVILGTFCYFVIVWKYFRDYWGILLMLFLYTGYVFASLGLFGVDCVARYRLPFMPLLYIFSAIAISASGSVIRPNSNSITDVNNLD